MLAGGLRDHGSAMQTSDAVLLYDPAAMDDDQCFTRLPKLPFPLMGVALAHDETTDRVFACGGKTDETLEGGVESGIVTGALCKNIYAFDFDEVLWVECVC